MKITELYNLYSKYYLVDTDTRNIRKNTIFFALKGTNFNGNKYAEEALNLGACFCVVDEQEYQTRDNIILVDDVLATLQKLAVFHRKTLNIPILALTGSNGKTTTKELIKEVLSIKFVTTATKGNLNNHIGVPLTLLSMKPQTQIGIVEMGANHLNEITFLSEIVTPDYGYITNFGKAHLEGFGSIEGVIKGKSELYYYLKKVNKTVFVNSHDEIQMRNSNDIKRVLFDNRIDFVDANPFVNLKYENLEIQSNLIGKYNYDNIAAAITIGVFFDISKDKIKKAIENYYPDNNRSQVIENKSNKIILDAYNANPTSMIAALENLRAIKSSKKSVILGDMFELGEDSVVEHQNIIDLASSLDLNNVLFVGENFCKGKTNHLQFKSFFELKKHLSTHIIEENTILIKGSRGMALERVLEVI